MKTIIQITKTGTIFSGLEQDSRNMRTEFNQKHYLRLPSILEPSILQYIQPYIDQAEFNETVNPNGLGLESCIKTNPASHLLHFLTNDKDLYKFIEQVAGCEKIGCFNGRVYHVTQNHKNYDRWHDDYGSTRMIAMSINLSTEIYSGGYLQIRDAESKKILHEVTNTGFGDAIIFRIAPFLDHRVTDVEGKVSKIAFAGWFQAEPDDQAIIKRRFFQLRNNLDGATKIKDKILNDSMVIAKERHFSHNLSEETVIFKPENTSYYSLDNVGTYIWSLIQNPISVKEIKASILNEYRIEQEQCEEDVDKLLEELAANELIVVSAKKLTTVTLKDGVRI